MWWSGLQLDDVARTLRRLGPGTFAAAFGLHVLSYLFRARRFQILVPVAERPPLAEVVTASAAHNLAVQVLPAKTGELTLIVYLRGRSGVSGSAATASLLISRLLDVLMLGALGGLAALVVAREHGGLALALAGGLFVGSLFVALVVARATWLTDGLARRLATRGARAQRAGEIIGRLGAALESAGHRSSIGPALLLSVPLWLCVFGFWVTLASGLGLPEHIGLLDNAFATASAQIGSLVPLAAFGGIGPMEAGWQLGYGILGVDLDTALAVGLSTHLVQLFNVSVLGGLAHLRMAARPKARPEAS
jgi:uncharacterized membrane protein YbhN (UPF0104 family)